MAGAVAFSGPAISVKPAYRQGVDATPLIGLRRRVTPGSRGALAGVTLRARSR